MDEAHDCAPAVRHDFIDAQHAFEDVENLTGGIPLPKQRLAGREGLCRLTLEDVL
jgi:hypothetical protein